MTVWALARFDLGMSEEAFWRSTPRMVYALIERWELEQERRDHRAGIVAATIANVNRRKNSKAYSPADFVPQRRQPRPLDADEQVALVVALNRAFGGEDLREVAA